MKTLKIISFFLLCSLLLYSCAKIVTPIGGPPDTTPPQIENIDPPNYTTQFNAKHIKLTFDEFVVLNNPNENVIISPPINKENIDFEIQGKNSIITIKDTLLPNTTYHLLFSNCFKDYREGNLLSGMQYTLSTGDSIDQGFLTGNITDAKSKKGVEDFFIFLYTEDIDSLPLTTTPRYITKSNKKGDFLFEHIKEAPYKIFALKDMNASFTFDMPNEEIAFHDKIVWGKALHSDSTNSDSLISIEMLSFLEEDTAQYLNKTTHLQEGKYQFIFKKAVEEYKLTPFYKDSSIQYYPIINPTRDTLTIYSKEKIVDTIPYFLYYDQRIDTVLFTPIKNTGSSSRRGKKVTTPKLGVQLTNQKELFKPKTLQFNYPIYPIDSADAIVIKKGKETSDTTHVTLRVGDSCVTALTFPFDFQERTTYEIIVRDSIFKGYNDTYNDSLKLKFTVKSLKDYGTLLLDFQIKDIDNDHIIYLTKENRIIKENIISTSTLLTYENLEPGLYHVKVVMDRNKNGKWDTGNYRNNLQPEPIIYIEKQFQIRGFWQLKEFIEL